MRLSKRTNDVKTSPTLALAAKAMSLKADGVDVISLSVGEPDWETLEPCKKAGLAAIQEGYTRYTPASGAKELKTALKEDFIKKHKIEVSEKNIIVTPGAKYGIQEALWALIEPGDSVGIFVPFWASYTTMVEVANGKPVLIDQNEDLSLNVQNLEKAIKEHNLKLLLINSPNNPSGSVWLKEDYVALKEVLKKHQDVQVIFDDIYQDLYWGEGDTCPHFFDTAPEMFDRSIVINGASKSFSMTGWRMGWATGPENLIAAMSRLQSQTTGCPSSIAQKATIAGISEGGAIVSDYVKVLKGRAKKASDLINNVEGLKASLPLGAFYLWVNLKEILKKSSMTDAEFSNALLEKKAVVVVPGSDFGQEGFARLSFAVSEDVFAEGVKRISDFCNELV